MTNEEQEAERRRAERKPIVTEVEFHVLKDMMEGVSVNISETGICFKTGEPLQVRMRYKVDGDLQEKYARLVWTKNEEGGMSYGFEFFEPPRMTPAAIFDDLDV